MPIAIQLLISAVAAAIAVSVAVWQNAIGNTVNQWIVLAVGILMLFGIWIFPEAKGGRGKKV